MFELFRIADIGSGSLYASPKPDGGQLPAALDQLKAHDIDTLACLLEPSELETLRLSALPAQCSRRQIMYVQLPIPDFGTPLLAELSKTVTLLRKRLLSGCNVLVHCRGGIGRTGTLCSAMLVADGMSPTNAIQQVTLKRGCAVPETTSQRNVIYGYYQSSRDPNRLMTGY